MSGFDRDLLSVANIYKRGEIMTVIAASVLPARRHESRPRQGAAAADHRVVLL